MKKSIFTFALAALIFGSALNTNAQDNNMRENRRAEMQAKQMERVIKDLKLSDEERAKFEPIYQNYQNELAAPRTHGEKVDGTTGASAQQENDGKKEKKTLTDAEATARLQAIFDRQAKEIEQSQKRLDIQKKYCAELSGILTPQQLLRVFRPHQQNRGPQQGGRGGFGGQGRRGGFGDGPRGGFGGQGGFE